MSKRYFNSDPYPLPQGDTKPSYIFTINDSTGSPADFSSYPSLIVRARFREQGATLSLAVITCTVVNATIGKFKIATWPAAVAAADEGIHELEIEVDYQGDLTEIQTVYNWVKFDVLEQFGETS